MLFVGDEKLKFFKKSYEFEEDLGY